ncbi:MAG: fumarylacetoacetate hydrolase family protein [Pseudomonadota bacterium]|nr:fumarylacetoacetate hydrolase family protein [Pseudomonadota bacterium]
MKICRYNDDRLGIVDGGEVVDVTKALEVIPVTGWPAPMGDALIANLEAVCSRAAELAPSGERHALSSLTLKSPVANPTKVIGAPVNYYAHLEESLEDEGVNFGRDIKTIDHYGLFLKNSVLVGAGEGVELHFTDRRNDHEVEVSMIIGKKGKNVPREVALDYVAAYAIGLDMTVRGTEERSLRKAIDSYSVLGPWLVTADEISDPDKLDFSIHVGDEERQNSNTDKLIFDCRKLIEYGSQFYTLYPGDVIMTGTPEGVGPVEPGDIMHCYCEGIGKMDVAVRAAE